MSDQILVPSDDAPNQSQPVLVVFDRASYFNLEFCESVVHGLDQALPDVIIRIAQKPCRRVRRMSKLPG